MKLAPLVTTAAIGFVLALPAARQVHAAYTGIQRCQAEDGTVVYSDRPCTFSGAQPVAMSHELNVRLTSEATRAASLSTVDADTYASMSQMQAMPVSRRSALDGCARTPNQLAMDLRGSIALHDVNRLAESFHWVGMTQHQAVPAMKRLERISGATVSDARYFDAAIGSLDTDFADAGTIDDGRAGLVQVALEGVDGAWSMELPVQRFAGCYFATL